MSGGLREKFATAARSSRLRCAIYTRKSSEEGLEQNFNSLHAQREACEAYVLSQKSEGWAALSAAYDDGGFSGGSMERPGLRRMMDDVAAGKIDIVVVYKVDRLTRSLADFAKMVELFDRHEVSFVSVTQAFNTTTSMGRLTLNVLLSFAQFEREVTGERIRDKIAASKKKGMWMGGSMPLGYDVVDRALVINNEEAGRVRALFQRYLELRSVHLLKAELDAAGDSTKAWTTTTDRRRGGAAFSRGALYYLLSNRTYLGQIVHHGEVYNGLHQPIVEQELFDRVQQVLAENRNERRNRPLVAGRSPLSGLIFTSDGQRMSPVHVRKGNGAVYRYYVDSRLQQGGQAGESPRVSASQVEALVLDAVRSHVESDAGVQGTDLTELRERISRVVVFAAAVEIHFRAADEQEPQSLKVPTVLRMSNRRRIIVPQQSVSARPRMNPALVEALRIGHAELRARQKGCATTSDVSESYRRRCLKLALLAPDIQRAIIDGLQPASLDLRRLVRGNVPLSWAEQRRIFGFDRL
jgi:site-specific DNA recombinase